MDNVIVNPNNRLLSPYAGIEPPLWAGLIASDLKSKDKQVAVIDAEAMNWDVERTCKEIRALKPKEVLIVVAGNNPSVSSTPKMFVTKKLCDNLRDLKVSVTGLHPSALPKETEEYLGVPVLKGKIFEGCPDIPFGLFPMNEYQAHVWHCLDGSPRSPYASVYTSLNCPFICEFCPVHTLYDGSRTVWYRDINKLIRELSILHDVYKVRNIKFWDEMFTLKKERVKEICNRIIQTGYEFNIWTYVRVDSIEPELLKLMKRAGINWVAYGFESGSDKILGASHKKATVEKARQAVEWSHQAGMNIMGNFMFGLPSDDIITMQETLDFAKSLNLEFVNMYACESMPGSQLYKGEDWTKFGQFNTHQTEAKKFTDYAFREFFTDLDYLDHIRNKFGEQSVKTIKEMLEFGKPKYVEPI
jgi:anaerobic magnesium-protoporphyrin IX monomethyl ester cyclase